MSLDLNMNAPVLYLIAAVYLYATGHWIGGTVLLALSILSSFD